MEGGNIGKVDESRQLYAAMLEGSKTAFANEMFTAAYHALMAAMYCAADLEDPGRLLEVQQLANEHYENLHLRADRLCLKSPIAVGLYSSLIQMVRSRIVLLPRSK